MNGISAHRDYNRTPLYLQVRDSLMARVQNGDWAPGRSIPNENDLATEYNVSQGTMRKALDLLEFQQIVVRRQGRGTFIREALDFDELPQTARAFLTFGDASLQGSRLRDSSGVLHDVSAVRRFAEGALEVAAWLERRALQKVAKGNQRAA